MSKLIKILVVLLLAWMIGPALGAADAPRVLEKDFTGVKSVKITLASGDCRLHAAKGKTLRVRNETTFPADRFEPEVRQEGDKVVVKEVYHGSGWKRGKVAWDIWVPKETKVLVRSASGDLAGKDLDIVLEANTASGDVDLARFAGEMKLNTASGDVELTQPSGNVKIRTASGDVSIDDGQAEISISSASGDVKVKKAAGKVVVSTASGDIEMKDVRGSGSISCASGDIEVKGLVTAGPWKMSAASGSVKVGLGAAAAHDLTLSAASGSVHLDYNGHALKGAFELMVAVNRGEIRCAEKGKRDTLFIRGTKFDRLSFSQQGESPKIKLKTHSGNVELRR